MKSALLSNPTAATYTDLGVWFAEQKQYACAADAFATSLQIQPDQPDADNVVFMFGVSLYFSGNAKEAIPPLQVAESHGFHDVRLHLILASASDELHLTEAAEAEWRAALAVDAQSSPALDGLSRDLVANNDYAGSIALLEDPTIVGQRTAVQSLNLGLAYAKTARFEEADKTLRDGLNTSPDSLELADELARVLQQLGQPQNAVAVLNLAYLQHPNDQDVATDYLQMLSDISPEKALELARQLLLAFPQSSKLLYLSGVLETKVGDVAQARANLQQSIALNPDFAPAYAALGSVMARSNDLPGAKQEWEKAIALGDIDPDVQQNLARVLKILGEAK
ncbi:MAG: tetratricopeptide repeat protein [Terracidiphilus sp.]